MLYQSENPHGGDIYAGDITLDFSANTNPFGTPPGVLDAVTRSLSELHRYPDPYCRALVAALARHERVEQSRILCGNGAAELIYAFCEAARPRTALELAPTFSEYSLAAQRVGCRVSRYLLHAENGFTVDDGLLDTLLRTRPDVLFLCNPNNPTGVLLDEMLLSRLLDACKAIGTRLFVDECFLDLTDGGKSLREHISDTPELFLLKAFTKSYGMAGIRLGYCLCGDEALLREMSRATQPWNVSLPAQAAGIAALRETDFLQRTRRLVAEQRAWLTRELEALGFRVCPSRANYLLFLAPPDLGQKLRARGIAVRGCADYHGLGAGWYRIAVRLPEENRTLIQTIREVLSWPKIS